MRQLSGVEANEGLSPTLLAAMGESGNNKPCVAYDTAILDNLGGQAEYGKVTGINGTLRAGAQGAIAYSFDSLASNSMKSSNPHSGCRAVEVSKTLDTTDPSPSKNQGVIAVVENIPYTVKIRQGCEGGGKGPLIQENKSATLVTNNDQYLFQPVAFAQNQRDEVRDLGDKAGALQAEPGMKQQTFIAEPAAYDARGNGDGKTVNTLTGDHENRVTDYTSVVVYDGANVTSPVNASNPEPGDPCHTLSTDSRNYVVYESHPQDSRAKETGETSPTVAVKWHKGAADTPLVCMATQQGGAEIRTDDKCPTITAAAGMSGNNQPVICLQGNGIDRADTAGCNGKGWKEDKSYTLNTIDRPAVAYGLDRASFNQGQNAKFDFTVAEEQQPTMTARGPGAVCCTTGSFTQATEEIDPTLMARDWKDPTVVCTQHYIVRRLTPTECARLQGFADQHGHLQKKKHLTDEEYAFWSEVRNTHARINGKKVQEYTEKQMLTWYNKLWTDSAEYKMWGNGIALPPALYCMQGIMDVLNAQED